MSLRNNLAATSTLWFVTLSGVSTLVSAADTKPLVPETCAQVTLTSQRHVGHPGKSILLPKGTKRASTPCSTSVQKPLVLASYLDARGGQALVDGRTQRALKQIYAKKSVRSSASELTNLCVAQTVLRDWSQASDACDAAVAGALSERANASKRLGTDRKAADVGVGTAYSNRAVMHWLSGDEFAAHNDLSEARTFAPKASYVMRNLEVSVRDPSLARVSVN